MKIVKLTVENIKRLSAVEITPTGELVIVGGKNDAGKSSLLDAIEMAIGGESSTPAQPVRRGQKTGRVVLDLGDLVVTRSFTEAGGRKLIVANKDGARFPSPQAMLDRLYGALSFDPLSFEREDSKTQAAILRNLVGLDVSDLDAQRATLYDERTRANRDVRALEVKVDSCQTYPDAPAAEVSIQAISDDLAASERARERVTAAATQRNALISRRGVLVEKLAAVRKDIDRLKQQLALAETSAAQTDVDIQAVDDALSHSTKAHDDAVAAMPDTAASRARLADAERINQQVRTNRQAADASAMLADARAVVKGLTAQIDRIEAEKQTRLAAAAFPVPGLGVNDDGVLVDGLPFDQASTSDRIRISVAIGLAMHPKLRVLLVRDGSLLGSDKLDILATMAADSGAQVWLELMQESPDDRTTVYIEDGAIRHDHTKTTATSDDAGAYALSGQ
jgi:energy-coupling factor transporter ATP-binding protein EcfA2